MIAGPDIDINWEKARSWASELDKDGGGWRMPSRAELEDLFAHIPDRNNAIGLFESGGYFVWSVEFVTRDNGEPDSGLCCDTKNGGVTRMPIKKSKGMRTFAVRNQ